MATIRGIRCALFDAYGTLFDVHTAAARAREALGEHHDRVSELWRSRQLQYTWLRSLMRTHLDFEHVTADALDYALSAVGIDDRALRDHLLSLYDELDAYPEVAGVLARLREGGIKTAILSNGTPRMLAAVVAHAGLELDAVLSVEEVGVFKPDPRVYALGEKLAPMAACTFSTSNAWDAHGAASAGLNVVWVNRFGQPAERLPGTPVAEVADLNGLADALLG